MDIQLNCACSELHKYLHARNYRGAPMLPDKFMALQDLDPKLQKPNPDQDPDP